MGDPAVSSQGKLTVLSHKSDGKKPGCAWQSYVWQNKYLLLPLAASVALNFALACGWIVSSNRAHERKAAAEITQLRRMVQGVQATANELSSRAANLENRLGEVRQDNGAGTMSTILPTAADFGRYYHLDSRRLLLKITSVQAYSFSEVNYAGKQKSEPGIVFRGGCFHVDAFSTAENATYRLAILSDDRQLFDAAKKQFTEGTKFFATDCSPRTTRFYDVPRQELLLRGINIVKDE